MAGDRVDDLNTLTERMLTEAREDAQQADSKAAALLSVAGVGLSILAAGLAAGQFSPSDLSVIGRPLWWIGTAMAFGSLACALASIWPRFAAFPSEAPVLYWGQAAKHESVEALRASLREVPQSRQERSSEQLWQISRIAARKFLLIRSTEILLGASIALIGASLAV